jgi:hypothetical protein
MSGYLYLRYLATFMKRCLTTCVSSYLYGVCLPVRCLLSTMSAFLYYMYLPSCMISAQLYNVCLLEWCMLNVVMSARPCAVCSSMYMMSAYLSSVCLAKWFLPTRTMYDEEMFGDRNVASSELCPPVRSGRFTWMEQPCLVRTSRYQLQKKKNIASCEDWTHDPWFTRPVLYHWAKEAFYYF